MAQVNPISPNYTYRAGKACKKDINFAMLNEDATEEQWKEFDESVERLKEQATFLRGFIKGLRGSDSEKADLTAGGPEPPVVDGVPSVCRWARPNAVKQAKADGEVAEAAGHRAIAMSPQQRPRILVQSPRPWPPPRTSREQKPGASREEGPSGHVPPLPVTGDDGLAGAEQSRAVGEVMVEKKDLACASPAEVGFGGC